MLSILQNLRQDPALEGAFSSPGPRPSLACSFYAPGIPLGQITQIKGALATQAILKFLAEHPKKRAAWVEESLSAYPPAFAQAGLDLHRLLFVEGREHFSWALAELLRSQVFAVLVVASALKGEDASLRRLQLAAERARVALLLAADFEGPAWLLRLRLEAVMEKGGLVLRKVAQAEAREAAS